MHRDSFCIMLDDFLEAYKVPGIVASIFTGDTVLNLEARGIKKLGAKDKLQIYHLLHLGSNTKAMTGFVAAYLVEHGLLEWQTRFLDLFPEMRDKARPEYSAITLQDLLTHRGYILEFSEDHEFEQLKYFDHGVDVVKERVAWSAWLLEQDPILDYKQETFTYSNAGYSMAAAMLEKVSDKTWEVLIQEIIFDSLGLEGGFSWPTDIDSTQPYGHYTEEGTDSLIALSLTADYKIGKLIAPAGDIHMSMPNYVKWLQANIRGKRGQAQILKASTYDYLHSLASIHKGYKMGWGAGWVRMGEERYSFSTHNGSGGTYYCQAFIIPELNVGLAIMSNAGDDWHGQGVKDLRNKLLKHIQRSWESR